jgi:hypothetical protein
MPGMSLGRSILIDCEQAQAFQSVGFGRIVHCRDRFCGSPATSAASGRCAQSSPTGLGKRLLGRAQCGDCTPVNRALGPTRWRVSVLTISSLAGADLTLMRLCPEAMLKNRTAYLRGIARVKCSLG